MPTKSIISDLSVVENTPQALCEELQRELKRQSSLERLALRPWDGLNADSCLWWAVPSPQWPAFHLAKLFVDWLHPDDHSDLLCGLHVEKGLELGDEHTGARVGALVLDADWAWLSLIRDLSNGRLAALVRSVASPAVPNLYLRIEVSDSIRPNEPYPGARILWRDGAYYGFECRGSDAALRLLYAHDTEGLAAPLEQPQNFSELAKALKRVPGESSLWYDLQLGITLRGCGPEVSGEVIAPKELIARHIQPFTQWIIESSFEHRAARRSH